MEGVNGGRSRQKTALFALGIAGALLVTAALLGGCGDRGASVPPTAAPAADTSPAPAPAEQPAGKYKRTVIDTGAAGGLDSVVSRILSLFPGGAILTLAPDGTGLLDFSAMGWLAGENEPVTWGPGSAIHISGEDGTWRLEGDTLHIETAMTHQRFKRLGD